MSLARLGYNIAGPNEIDVKHITGLYATHAHNDFCKMMLQVGDDMNEFLQRIVKRCSHERCYDKYI
jgi:hypothetical protein